MPYTRRGRERDANPKMWVDPSFHKGVASVPDARLLEDGYLAKCENAYPARSGRIHRRLGYTAVTGGTLAAAARATRRFVDEDGAHMTTLVWSGTDIIEIRAGVAKTIKSGIAATGTIAHEVWKNAVYYSDGTNKLHKITRALTVATATLASDMTAGDADLTFTAKTAGWGGNGISIQFVNPGAINQSLAITNPTTDHFVVSLATDGAGAITSTANTVKTAVDGDGTMSARVSVAVQGTGAGHVNALAAAHLAGGLDVDDYTDTHVSDAYSFTYLAKRSGSERLFGIDAADETNLRWCDITTPDTWNALSVWSPGGRFVACGEVGDAFLAVTDEMCYRIDGTSPTTWDANAIQSDGLGCRAPATFKVVEGVALWWSVRGLAYFDGTRPKLLSDMVYDNEESGRCLVITDVAAWPKMFAINTGDHYILYSPSEAAHSCDRAMILDFRTQAWGGPYKFGFEAICGDSNLRDTPYPVPIVATASKVLTEDPTGAIYADDGSDTTLLLRSRTFDGGGPLRDQVHTDMRAAVNATAGTSVVMRLLVEDETSARTGASGTLTVTSAGHETLRKRIANIRGETGTLEVEVAAGGAFELLALSLSAYPIAER